MNQKQYQRLIKIKQKQKQNLKLSKKDISLLNSLKKKKNPYSPDISNKKTRPSIIRPFSEYSTSELLSAKRLNPENLAILKELEKRGKIRY